MHDGRVGARCAARDPRAVVDADSAIRRAGERGAGEELGGDHRAVGREREPLGEVARG